MDDARRGLIPLLLGQSIDRALSIHIGNKTEPLSLTALGKLIIACRVQDDPEAVNDGVTVRFNDGEDLVKDRVQLFVFLSC